MDFFVTHEIWTIDRLVLLTSTVCTAPRIVRSLTLHCKQTIYRTSWLLLHGLSILWSTLPLISMSLCSKRSKVSQLPDSFPYLSKLSTRILSYPRFVDLQSLRRFTILIVLISPIRSFPIDSHLSHRINLQFRRNSKIASSRIFRGFVGWTIVDARSTRSIEIFRDSLLPFVFGASEPANKWYNSALCPTSDVQHGLPTTEPSDAGVEAPDPFARSPARLSHRVVVLQTTCLPVASISREPTARRKFFFLFLFGYGAFNPRTFLVSVCHILLFVTYCLLFIYLLYICEKIRVTV